MPAPAPDFEAVYDVPRRRILWIDAVAVALFPVFMLLLTFEATHHAAFVMLTDKLGVIGLPYTLSFLLASVLGARLAFEARRRGAPGRVFWTYLGLAAFCLFVGGEHISWGQAAVHYRTPFGYGKYNKFGLFNLHNLPVFDEAHSILLLVCGVAGLVSMSLWRNPRLQAVSVPPVLAPMVWAVTIMAVLQNLSDFDWFYISLAFDMNVFVMRYAIEFVIGLVCLLTIGLNGRLLRRTWREAATPAWAAAERG